MNDAKHVPLAIIGGGPAGLTAAIYGVRAGIDCELFERGAAGGQMFITDRIENYPGFPEGIAGPELADRMREQALRLGAVITQEEITGVQLDSPSKKLFTGSGVDVTCDALIIATGSWPNSLGIPGEKELLGRGVSYCATCDGNFFRDQKVAVIGGGDSACQEAAMLSKIAGEVSIIHRRDQFRAQKTLADCAINQPNITVLFDTVVDRIDGDQAVTGLSLRNVKSGEKSKLGVEGVFIYVGVNPVTDFLKGAVELDEEGYIKAGEDTATSVPGVFAAGDVRAKPARQISTAVGDGANAVRAVELYLIQIGLSCKYV